jgi:hypothetical protein
MLTETAPLQDTAIHLRVLTLHQFVFIKAKNLLLAGMSESAMFFSAVVIFSVFFARISKLAVTQTELLEVTLL